MARTAFVTGGTGFLGINLVEALTQQGWDITALHRSSSDLTYLKRFPVSLVEGSLWDKESLINAIPQGTQVIFHLAGDTNMWRKKNEQQYRTNVLGTRYLVEAAAANGAHCFIHTSSVSAWGNTKGITTEETEPIAQTSFINYEKTKLQGEEEALNGRGMGMKVVIVNPASIVGPYDNNNWGKIFLALKNKEVPFVAPGENNFVHVSEVVKGHIAAVDKGKDGEKYILSGINSNLSEYFKEAAQLMGIPLPPVAPKFMFRILGQLMPLTAAISGKEPLITPELA
ncbi:MAG: NAD-dependent epimerase/dehydratase family protein, partial [Bacteroidota bacterium]